MLHLTAESNLILISAYNSTYHYEGAENWSDAADQCSVDTWCRDGNCPDGQTCFVVNNCNVQDFVREQLEQEKEALGIADEVEEKVILDIDDPKRTNFCGSEFILFE